MFQQVHMPKFNQRTLCENLAWSLLAYRLLVTSISTRPHNCTQL